MAANRVLKFSTISMLQSFLNGALRGANIASGVDGIVGLTLKFTSPGVHTVTFVASSGTSDPYASPTFLRFADIKSQIEAVATGVSVRQEGGTIILIETAPTSGVALAGDGTANKLLGFDTGNATVGKVYSPPGVTPGAQQWTWIDSTGENAYLVTTWE